MKNSMILGGLSVVLFAAGLIFFTNSIASKALATETIGSVPDQKPVVCQQLMKEGTCGCVANGGSCNCGKNGGGSCQAANTSSNGVVDQKSEGGKTCGCQRAAQ